jgi:hypothetical protein
MSLTLLIYLIELFVNIKGLFSAVMVLCIAGLFLMGLAWAIFEGTVVGKKDFVKYLKISSWVFCVSLVGHAVIPSKETMYIMVASYAGEQVVRSEEFQETYGKVRVILNNKLDDIIQEKINPKQK